MLGNSIRVPLTGGFQQHYHSASVRALRFAGLEHPSRLPGKQADLHSFVRSAPRLYAAHSKNEETECTNRVSSSTQTQARSPTQRRKSSGKLAEESASPEAAADNDGPWQTTLVSPSGENQVSAITHGQRLREVLAEELRVGLSEVASEKQFQTTGFTTTEEGLRASVQRLRDFEQFDFSEALLRSFGKHAPQLLAYLPGTLHMKLVQLQQLLEVDSMTRCVEVACKAPRLLALDLVDLHDKLPTLERVLGLAGNESRQKLLTVVTNQPSVLACKPESLERKVAALRSALRLPDLAIAQRLAVKQPSLLLSSVEQLSDGVERLQRALGCSEEGAIGVALARPELLCCEQRALCDKALLLREVAATCVPGWDAFDPDLSISNLSFLLGYAPQRLCRPLYLHQQLKHFQPAADTWGGGKQRSGHGSVHKLPILSSVIKATDQDWQLMCPNAGAFKAWAQAHLQQLGITTLRERQRQQRGRHDAGAVDARTTGLKALLCCLTALGASEQEAQQLAAQYPMLLEQELQYLETRLPAVVRGCGGRLSEAVELVARWPFLLRVNHTLDLPAKLLLLRELAATGRRGWDAWALPERTVQRVTSISHLRLLRAVYLHECAGSAVIKATLSTITSSSLEQWTGMLKRYAGSSSSPEQFEAWAQQRMGKLQKRLPAR